MIRPAVPSDLKAVVDIAKASFFGDDAFGASWLIRELAKPGTELFVEDASLSLIRGFMLTQTHRLGLIIRLIATAPDARKQGVGKALLEAIKGPAFTWIRDENEGSQALFKSMGWMESVAPVGAKLKRTPAWRYFSLAVQATAI